MKVILLDDIKGVGKKNEIVNASEGYAKNYLFPKKLAVEANKSNVNHLDNIKKNQEAKRQEELEQARLLGDEIEKKQIKIAVKIGNNGKLFGAVTNKEISAALKEQAGLDIEKKKIVLSEPIKDLGQRQVDIKLHPKVTAKLNVSVEELR